MGDWPKDLPAIDMDTQRSIAASADGTTVRLQKDVDGIGQQVSYSVHAGGRKLKQPFRMFQLPLDQAVDRFVRLYNKHLRPKKG